MCLKIVTPDMTKGHEPNNIRKKKCLFLPKKPISTKGIKMHTVSLIEASLQLDLRGTMLPPFLFDTHSLGRDVHSQAFTNIKIGF